MRAQSKILSLIGVAVVVGGLLVLGHSRDESVASSIDQRSARGDITRHDSPGIVGIDAETPVPLYQPLTSDGQ